MKSTIHIGCSAFNNIYWKSIFYPEDLPRTKWFEYYAQHFRTYEINATFYRMPTVKSLKSWYNKTPHDFVFAVKAHKTITHYKRFAGCETEMATFYEVCREGLGDKLGCVLFQLPPSFSYTPEKLDLIIDSLDLGFDNVVEFRHESWWIAEVYEALQKNNITFCSVSYPKIPEAVVATSNIGYVRLHGAPKLFYSGYSDAQLQKLFSQIQQQEKWKKVFVYFNNTASTKGIENALAFKKLNLK